MSSIETYEDASMIKAVLNMAIFDALNFKKPKKPAPFVRPEGSRKKDKRLNPNYVSTDPEYLSWDARRFLRKSNRLFCYYCSLVDIDPEFLSERIERAKKLIDRNKNKLSIELETISERILLAVNKQKIKLHKKHVLY